MKITLPMALLVAVLGAQTAVAKPPERTTASIGGSPFIWSQSSWKWQKLRDVPDRLAGEYTLMPLHLK